MATNQLTTVSGSGEQTTTQTPQSANQSASGGTPSSDVQPGTATSLLSGQGSVALHPAALSTVNFNPAASGTSAVTATAPKPVVKHHVNPTLLGFSVLLLAVAVVLFWTTSRSVKSTT